MKDESLSVQLNALQIGGTMTGYWKHYKGDFYSLVFLAVNENTNDIVVVYSKIVDGLPCFWTRPLSQWEELVEHEGVKVPRFSKVKK